jgi:hypothetical protein
VAEPHHPTVFEGTPGPITTIRRHWLKTLVVVVALVMGFEWWVNAFHDRDYAPEQYIKFSHKLHAGDLHMDCKYCHFNAARGKHAGVPPMSVCLGCHGDPGGKVNADKPEIQKLLAIKDQGKYTDENGVVHEGGVVHWNRVHKLPDFVYFSHQWHIAAGVACQTCHGPVEEMAVVKQYATLTMGWCLDCHRKSHYVGGLAYDAKDPATFTVGTFNYDLQRARVRPDAEAVFAPRPVKGNGEHAEGHKGGFGLKENKMVVSLNDHEDAVKKLFDANPGWSEETKDKIRQLPLWRVADLPETHRAYYWNAEEAAVAFKGKNDDQVRDYILSHDYMNSPTQCSTCHQ